MNEQDKKLVNDLNEGGCGEYCDILCKQAAQVIEWLSAENEVLSNSSRVSYDALRAENERLSEQRDELLAVIEKFLADNDPEGFGCACIPGHICGPCSEAKRQIPLHAAIAKVKGQI